MSSQKYYGLVTDKGLAKLRAAAQGTAPLMLSHMAFGDGNGAETAPTGGANSLVNERYRAPLSDKRPHETNPSILYVEAIIPPGVGGWTLREAGIYDSDGDLIVIAKTPVMDVALLAEGATTEGLVRLPIVFESTQSAQFLIDPTVLLATQSWVIDRIISRPFITVESVTLKTPPTNPTAFALYVIPTGATGAWANKTGQMAHWHGAWQFANAPIAKVVGASDTGKYWRRTATGWAEFAASETDAGLLRLATAAEQKAGTIKDAANHPAGTAAAVQSGAWNFAVATGTANALTATLTPALSAYEPGLMMQLVPTKANTGAATLAVNGLLPTPIVQDNGEPLIGGELYEGVPVSLICTGTAFTLVSSRRSIGAGVKVFKIPGTDYFTAPLTGWYDVECFGAGAGGGGVGSASNGSAGGGGAGGRARKRIWLSAGTIVPITVASGGAGGGNGGQGFSGGTSSFGSHCSATGGTGGKPNPAGDGGIGGQGVGGDENTGGGGGTAGGLGSVTGGPGGAASNGGAGGGGGYGIAGPGQAPGGGGGGSGASGPISGGAGGRGEVRVRW